MASLTPLHQGRPTVIRDPLSGQFLVSGPRKTADVLEGFGVSKRRAMSDEELAHRKRAQGYISRTTSTLGLTALGLKGGSVYASRAARAAQGTRRGVKLAARAERLNNAALNTGIVGSGIGGLGGFNFASYTAAEAKRRNVKKNWESGMDFGLGTVHQGEHEEISKLQMPKMPKMPSFGMGRFSAGSAANSTVKSSVVKPKQITATANKPRFTPLQRNVAIGAGSAAAVGGTGYAVGRRNGVQKAYDPERNRQRRLRAYGDAGILAAGGLGTAAAIQGGRAARSGKEYRRTRHQLRNPAGERQWSADMKSTKRVLNAALQGANHDLGNARGQLKGAQASHAAGVKALKHSGKAAGLGVGAAGLAIGSHRLREYSKGRGRSYKPMRSIEY